MAVIGAFEGLGYFFKAYPKLAAVEDYIASALDSTSAVYQRICALKPAPNEARIEVSYPLTEGARAIEQAYYLKSAEGAFYETHRAFVDFQLVVGGYEYMHLGSRARFEVKQAYDEGRDLIVYEGGARCSEILLQAGDLAVLFPDDVHAGGLEPYLLESKPLDSKPLVQKSVIKVPLAFFT